MNKKGIAQFALFAIFVGILAVVIFGAGSLIGYTLKSALGKIPIIAWVVMLIALLYVLTRRKN